MSGLNKSFLEKSASAPGNSLFSKPAFLKTFLLFTLLIIIFSLSVSNSGAETSFLINKSNVLVNTTYKEGVSLSPGYPVITDRSGVTEYSSSTTQPQQWTSVNGSINFLTTANNLPIGNYTFTIRVYDRANNSREDSKNFTIFYKFFGCGDKIVNASAGEECDDGNLINTDGCTNQCKIVVCGNSKVESGEECDGANLNGMECPFGGSLKCYSNNCSYDVRGCASPPNFCGDGRVQPGEQCDGSSQSIACTAFNPTYTGGTARCIAGKCIYDTSSCVGGATSGFCGDSLIERPNSAGFNEQCDSSTYGKDCSDINPEFIGGSLSCTNCSYNTTQCVILDGSYCGDGILNSRTEVCDKSDWGLVKACSTFNSFVNGTLRCGADCHFNTSNCVVGIQNSTCSNKKKDGMESDVDCGGYCLCCPSAKSCVINNDCCSGFCRSGVCAEPRCDDKILNGLETDVDCGGSCPKCNDTSSCNVDDDCTSGFCNLQNKCSTPNCNDDEKNGLETDKDCGGDCPAKCKIGMACFSGVDCESGYCDAGVCSCDQSKDTDADGMPDCWELNYGLDPNDPDDANKDYDGDGKTNLEEYRAGTDPTRPDELGRAKSNTFAIILLILGVLLMGGSTAFLIYSRKVILPEQRKKASAARSAGTQSPSRQPGQSSFNKLSGQPAGSSARLTQNISLADVLARRKQAGSNINPSQSASQSSARSAAKQSQSSLSDNKMFGFDSKKQDRDDSDEFIPISELGRKQQPGGKDKDGSNAKQDSADNKKEDGHYSKGSSLSASFEKLKSLVQKSVQGNASSGSESGSGSSSGHGHDVAAISDKNQPASQKDVKQALKELSDSVKDKTKTNKDEKAKK